MLRLSGSFIEVFLPLVDHFEDYFGILFENFKILSRRASTNDGVPPSSSSVPGSSSRSLYMGGRSFRHSSLGGSSTIGLEQGGIDLNRHIHPPFISNSNGGAVRPMPTMVSPHPSGSNVDAGLVLPVPYHHESYNNTIPPIGPRYFQDPFLLPRPSFYSSHTVTPTGVMDSNLYYNNSGGALPSHGDDSSTIVSDGLVGSGSPDFLSQGCQERQHPAHSRL